MTGKANIEAVLDHAIEVLGSALAANDWLDKRSATLGSAPRELAATPEGRDRVLLHLNGISRQRTA